MGKEDQTKLYGHDSMILESHLSAQSFKRVNNKHVNRANKSKEEPMKEEMSDTDFLVFYKYKDSYKQG